MQFLSNPTPFSSTYLQVNGFLFAFPVYFCIGYCIRPPYSKNMSQTVVLKHFNLFVILFAMSQVSQAFNEIDFTLELKIRSLVLMLSWYECHIGVSCANAPWAYRMRVFTSCLVFPSEVITLSKNVITSILLIELPSTLNDTWDVSTVMLLVYM